MNRRDYWRGRYLQIRAANELSTIRFEQSMLATVDALNTKINGELVDWYKRYSRTAKVDFGTSAEILKKARTEGWHQTLDEFQRLAIQGGHTDELDMEYIRSQTARLEQLQTQLVSMIAPVLPELTNSMSDEMVEQYRYQYEHAMYLNEMASGNSGNFATFDEASLKLVVAKPWQGGNFSQRLWGNFQSTLPNMLMQTLAESVVLGRNPSRLARELAKTHKHFTESNLHRLINTEMAHVDESANYQALQDIGAEWYEYMATLESRTCEVCGHLDEKHFKMADRRDGVNFPPIHPYCRCDTVYWEPNMPAVGKRWSKDPITGKRKMVDDISFDEWAVEKGLVKKESATKSTVSQSVADKLGKKMTADIDAALMKAPKDMQQLWAKFHDVMAIDEVTADPAVKSHYDHKTSKVTLNTRDLEGGESRNPLDVYFHEMGHLIDDKAGGLSGGDEFKETLDKDYAAFMKPRIARVRESVTLESPKTMTFGRKSYYDSVEVKFGRNGKLTPASAKMLAQNEVRDEIRAKYSKVALTDVSDMTNAAGDIEGGLFGHGHQKGYYWTPGNQGKEAFAEMTSATINNPESLELIKLMFPAAYDMYLKMVAEAIK